jgi:hypothetical protein
MGLKGIQGGRESLPKKSEGLNDFGISRSYLCQQGHMYVNCAKNRRFKGRG